jgi:hypothetical protein
VRGKAESLCAFEEADQGTVAPPAVERSAGPEANGAAAELALPHVGAALTDLLPFFPPEDLGHRLRREFVSFDLMFRYVHQPSFQRRAAAVLSDLPSTPPDFLAMLSAAFLCAVSISTDPAIEALERRLRALAEALLRLCEDAGTFTAEYVHALFLLCASHLGGEGNPAKMFLALGRAYHAAILAGIHLDGDEGLFEREIRRRLWCHITMQRE